MLVHYTDRTQHYRFLAHHPLAQEDNYGLSELMESLHNRMPGISKREDYPRWLAPAEPTHLPTDLLRPSPAEEMKAWRVGNDDGNVRNNRPELVEPVT